MTGRSTDQAASPRTPVARGPGRTPPQPLATHAWLPGADGECWCPLPKDNRVHQVDTAPDEVGARILGEREDTGQ